MESEMDVSESPMTNGVEVPRSNNSKTEDLKKTPGTTRKIQDGQEGDLYEVNLVALLFLRAIKSRQEFHIVSNMSAAGSFDDVVLRLGDRSIFLQLKHKKEDSKTLIQITHFACSNNFKLSKYLESYLKISRQWQENRYGLFEKSLFVVYTNARISECLANDLGDSDLLGVVSSGGKSIFLKKLFENLSKYRTTLYNAVHTENFTNTELLKEAVNALGDKNAIKTPSKAKLEKLLSEVDVLLALPDYQKFVSQYYFCGEQASQKKLEYYIKEELHTVCGTDRLFKELIEGVKKWWESRKVSYLKENVEFWKEILRKSIADLEKKYLELNIKFDEKYLETIRESLSDSSRILFINTHCVSLTSLKVSQSFTENFVVDSATLGDRLTEVMALWKLRDVLVVTSDSLGEEVVKKFANLLKLFPEKKLLIISTGRKPLVVDLLEQFGVTRISDNVSLQQFDEGSQTQLLETKVFFQGKPVELKTLADEPFLKGAVNEEVLEDLLTTNEASNIGNKIYDEENYYLPRTFVRQEFVNEGIFKNRDIYIAVKGMSLDELKSLVPSTEKVAMFDVNRLTKDDSQSRVIIINSYDDFKQLCEIHNNIHLI